MSERVLTLYLREYCDLCRRMVAELQGLQSRYGFSLHTVDIDDDDELEEKYALQIPVVEYQGQVLFYYHVDQRALDAAFGAMG